jgi:hypothetical protein
MIQKELVQQYLVKLFCQELAEWERQGKEYRRENDKNASDSTNSIVNSVPITKKGENMFCNGMT